MAFYEIHVALQQNLLYNLSSNANMVTTFINPR